MLRFPSNACWIGSDHPFDLHEVYLNFRRAFTIQQLPQRACLALTADSRYKLWINGEFVARGPARCYPHAQSVDQFDVTARLRAGENVIAIQVYQPGYSHFAYVHRGAAGVLAWLVSDDKTVLVTDGSWRVKRDPSFDALVPRVSIYGSGVEERDLNLDEDWQALGYDDTHWAMARPVVQLGEYPWMEMHARKLPYLIEHEVPMTLLETRVGASVSFRDAHRALRAGWFAASPTRHRAECLSPYEVREGASPQPLVADPNGWFSTRLGPEESAYWLFDLGRDYIGQGWVEIHNASGQESLFISYHEKIRAGELVISDPQTYCRVRLTDRFRLRAGNQMAETFALRGGRYLLFRLSGATNDARLHFHFRASEYPLEVTKPLTSSDPLLANIITLCEDTMRACLQDGFIDSPWRENAQWVGDALPQALTLSSMSDDTRPLRRVIEMAAQAQYPDGMLPSVLPGEVHAYTVVDYGFIWVELLALYWQLMRDAEFARAQWNTLVKLLDRFDCDRSGDGLIVSPPGRRLFLDWSSQARAEPNAVYNLHYLLALRVAAQLAGEIDEPEAASVWNARGDALTAAVRAAFWQDERWYDDLAHTTFSQLATALALLSGAAREDEHPALLDALAARSLDKDDHPAPGKMILASPFMHHYVFEALRRGGREAEVIEIIKQRWGRWVKAGYPTTWENWNVDFPDGSQCHAFSAHPRYHLAEIARTRGTL